MCVKNRERARVQMNIPPDSRLAGAINNRSPSRTADNPRDEDNNGDKVKEQVVCYTPYGRHYQLFNCKSTTSGAHTGVV